MYDSPNNQPIIYINASPHVLAAILLDHIKQMVDYDPVRKIWICRGEHDKDFCECIFKAAKEIIK